MRARPQRFAGEVVLDARIDELVIQPSTVTLFRFSAATWNAHRIHFDQAYARSEGYPDVLVQSHLHGAWLAQMVMTWAGPLARLREFSWQNRGFATPADRLRCTGRVTAIEGRFVTCDLREENQDGVECAPASAVVELPERGGEQ